MDTFERRAFEYGGRSEIDWPGSNTYDLTDRELQMSKKLFKYNNPNELRYALIDADKEIYDELLNDLKMKNIFLNDQIKTKIGVERTR